MKIKKLELKQKNYLEYIADISIKGLFGIRFMCRKACYANEYNYKYIINGTHFGDYLGYKCDSFEDGKQICEKINGEEL